MVEDDRDLGGGGGGGGGGKRFCDGEKDLGIVDPFQVVFSLISADYGCIIDICRYIIDLLSIIVLIPT